MKIKSLFIVLILVLSSACGFHLRGSYVLPAWFNSVYISGIEKVNQDFGRELLKELQAKKISMVPSIASARTILNLKEDRLARSVYAKDPTSGITTSYQIGYSLSYEIYTSNGAERIEGKYQAADNYEFDSNNLLSAQEKENRIKVELINNAVNSIFSHLSRRK